MNEDTALLQQLAAFYPARRVEFLNSYEIAFLTHVMHCGGFYNAHAHIDRAYTLEDKYLSHIGTTPLEASSLPLSVKQNLVGDLHNGLAYTEGDLRERMTRAIEWQIAFGVRRIDTCIDATPDIGEGGLLAIRIALELKEQYKDKIAIRVAPNPIFGFKKGTKRWEVYEQAARMEGVDFLSALPEKDYYTTPADRRDGKVGFKEHIRRVVELACEVRKSVDLHLDQANDPREKGTEMLLEDLQWMDQPVLMRDGPVIRVIHMISPSAYDEMRFQRLVEQLLEYNVGVIVCPTAAISMRQLRPVSAPLHNSLARLIELVKKKVSVYLGTDNICDVFVPGGNGDPLSEVLSAGSNMLRFYPPSILAKLACGVPLNDVDRTRVGSALYEDTKAFRKIDEKWEPAVS
ncbi:MAG: hypothetical protein MN733_09405 [Nitrososphaera sp.]|nr:hypothetical protein [Nitrososphaera sp.]